MANVLSDTITSLDSKWPGSRMTAGQGAPARTIVVEGSVTAANVATVALDGYLQMVRIPSNCSVKKVEYVQDSTATTMTWNCGLHYSDATDDGTQAQYQGTVISDTFFASAYAGAAVVTYADITFQSGTYHASATRQPIWEAVALSADPGGMFDVTLQLDAALSGNATVSVRVTYTVPAD